MIYLNYLSKVRNRIGMTQEELQRELDYNYGRIVTKTLTNVTRVNYNDRKATILNNLNIAIRVFLGESFWDPGISDEDIAKKYHTFQIPKRSGGFREICAPDSEIKEIQEQILKVYTKGVKFLPHNAAHGFTRKRNCKTALQVHQKNKSRWFLKLDIKDFFPNTTKEHIINAMRMVYPFCTLQEPEKERLIRVCTLNGATPQGAPTSPMLTNMVMVPIDVEITKYCKEHNLIYTRYADDILISSKVAFDWQQTQEDVQALLGHYELKKEKTRYGSFNGRNWNLGLMYNNQGEITVGHKKKQLVKNLVHNYVTREEERTYDNWYKLIGMIGYCAYIEPEYFNKYLDIIKANEPV